MRQNRIKRTLRGKNLIPEWKGKYHLASLSCYLFMRNSTFNPERGIGRTFMSSLGVTFMQNSSVCLPQMAGAMETRGRRWETLPRWTPQGTEGFEGEGVGRRESLMRLPRHLLRGPEGGGSHPQPCHLLCFLSLFPRHAILVSILHDAVGVEHLEVRNCDFILAPNVSTHPLRLDFHSQAWDQKSQVQKLWGDMWGDMSDSSQEDPLVVLL